MGFIAFIFIFILVAVVAIAMRVIVAFLQLKRKVGSVFGGNGGGDAAGSRADNGPQRQKVYDKNVGEYVKFEEIAVSEPETPHEVEFREESQVSDVEFEEIRD